MSGGQRCRCAEAAKPIRSRRWRVWQRHCNHSAFNGGHYTPSAWSAIGCLECGMHWRTKANYVHQIKDVTQREIQRG